MGTRLFEELKSLRDLNERHELEVAKRALEESGRQKDLLLKEADHRIRVAKLCRSVWGVTRFLISAISAAA